MRSGTGPTAGCTAAPPPLGPAGGSITAASRRGPAHGQNEDRWGLLGADDLLLLAVADGMGGTAGGGTAAGIALRTLLELADAQPTPPPAAIGVPPAAVPPAAVPPGAGPAIVDSPDADRTIEPDTPAAEPAAEPAGSAPAGAASPAGGPPEQHDRPAAAPPPPTAAASPAETAPATGPTPSTETPGAGAVAGTGPADGLAPAAGTLAGIAAGTAPMAGVAARAGGGSAPAGAATPAGASPAVAGRPAVAGAGSGDGSVPAVAGAPVAGAPVAGAPVAGAPAAGVPAVAGAAVVGGAAAGSGAGGPDGGGVGGRADLALLDAMSRAHQRVRAAAAPGLPDALRPGSTLTAALILGDRLVVGHVGDSACWLFRRGVLIRLTEEHTHAAVLVAAGAVERGSPAARRLGNLLTRHLGMPGELRPQLAAVRLHAGDRLLLATDGLSRALPPAALAALLAQPETTAGRLVGAAVAVGATDDVTAVLATISDAASGYAAAGGAAAGQAGADPVRTGDGPRADRAGDDVLRIASGAGEPGPQVAAGR